VTEPLAADAEAVAEASTDGAVELSGADAAGPALPPADVEHAAKASIVAPATAAGTA